MKNTFTLFFICLTLFVYPQWQVVDSVDREYTHIYFYNEDIGFVSDYAVYKKTIDAGQTWTSSVLPHIGGYSDRFYFLNPDTGFRGGYITHDGGQNWTSQSTFSSPFCFTEDNKYGFATTFMPFGNQAPTFKSANWGENWQMKTFIVPDPNTINSGAKDISFADSSNGIIVGLGGDVFYTKNGATTWTRKQPLGSSFDLTSVYMVDKDIAYAAAHPEFIGPFSQDVSKIIRTGNGGDTWSDVGSVYAEVKKIFFLDSLTGYLCNNYGFYETRDGGVSWERDTTVSGVRDFSFINSRQVYLLTWDSIFTNGRVYKRDVLSSVGKVNASGKNSMTLYPNPVAGGVVFMDVDVRYIGEVAEVTDVMGKSVMQISVSGTPLMLPTSALAKGNYFVRIKDVVTQFVKE